MSGVEAAAGSGSGGSGSGSGMTGGISGGAGGGGNMGGSVGDAGTGGSAGSSPPPDAPQSADTSSLDLPPDLRPDLPPDLPPDLAPDRPADLPIDAPVPVGTGLKGDYYDGSQFEVGDTGELEETVNGEAIDFDWGAGRAHPDMDDDWFSVRWTGKIMPRFTETYTIRTVSDDGIRVWIDDRLIIDHYTPHTAASQSATVALQAYRQHTIKVEYFEQTGNAAARLFWSSPSQPEQIVPRAALFPP